MRSRVLADSSIASSGRTRQQSHHAALMGLDAFCEQRWGGKRGLLRHLVWSGVDLAGGFRRFRSVDWARVDRLVFVCKGNICRSPYAEGRARVLSLETASFGIEVDARVPANAAAAQAAHARGVDLSHTRARRQGDLTLGAADLLVGMEPRHVRALEPVARAHGCQITLLGVWSEPERPYIGDPLGRSQVFFARCFAAIDSGIDGMRRRLTGGSQRR
jgi:protein-tyrosine phosphatase